MVRLSVIIITKNEASHIVPCLDSVRFADEWIVVDSGSADNTVELARNWGAFVIIEADWQGFGVQKNRALKHAKGQWILSIDADERVNAELKDEIERVIGSADTSIQGYAIPRLSSYCGHFMHHGGWWPDHVLRLFRKGTGCFSDRKVHESVILSGKMEKLKNPLIHYTHANLEAVIQKMNAYSTAGADIMAEKGKAVTVWGAVLHGVWAFLRAYIFRAGFKDGAYGFMAAISHAEGTYYRYIKCWLLYQNQKQKIG